MNYTECTVRWFLTIFQCKIIRSIKGYVLLLALCTLHFIFLFIYPLLNTVQCAVVKQINMTSRDET